MPNTLLALLKARSHRDTGRALRLRRASSALATFGAWLILIASLDAGRSRALDDPTSNACQVTRKKRLFVSLADGVDLNEYQQAASAAQTILRLVKTELCTATPNLRPHSFTPSLRKALAAGRAIVIEEVRFDDEALGHARVLVRAHAELDAHHIALAELAWRVHLHLAAAWQIDAVRDEPVAKP